MQALQTWCAQGSRKGVRSRSGCVDGSVEVDKIIRIVLSGERPMSPYIHEKLS